MKASWRMARRIPPGNSAAVPELPLTIAAATLPSVVSKEVQTAGGIIDPDPTHPSPMACFGGLSRFAHGRLCEQLGK